MLFNGEPEYKDTKRERLMAIISSNLVALGLEPIRPDYSKISFKLPLDVAVPVKMIEVLIFDDSIRDIVKTLRGLAGWPNVKFSFHQYQPEESKYSRSIEEKVAEQNKAASVIAASGAQIVLMDQGLGAIDGSDVVRNVIATYTKHPIFVPNTGGEPDELQNAGAMNDNCDKGQRWGALSRAIGRLNATAE